MPVVTSASAVGDMLKGTCSRETPVLSETTTANDHERMQEEMECTLKALEDARRVNLILLEMSEAAERDAARAHKNACELSTLLEAVENRAFQMHETLLGVRAFAESDVLSDHERVALILRLLK